MRAIEKFLPAYLERCAKKNRQPFRKTAQEWMEWWLEIGVDESKIINGQIELEEDDD
jgi:hypothetical protein